MTKTCFFGFATAFRCFCWSNSLKLASRYINPHNGNLITFELLTFLKRVGEPCFKACVRASWRRTRRDLRRLGGAQSRGLFAGQRWSPASQQTRSSAEVAPPGRWRTPWCSRWRLRWLAPSARRRSPPGVDLLALGAEAEEPFRRRYDHRDTGRSVSYPPGAPATRARPGRDAVGLIDASPAAAPTWWTVDGRRHRAVPRG